MIVRNVEEIAGTARDVSGPGWRSRRIVLRDDAINFSLHWTEISAGAEQHLEYKHHYEANLCVSGEGEVVDVATGAIYPVTPGVMYALDRHDRHILRANTHMTLVCVFHPALSGHETHDADGSYLPSE